MIVNQEPLFRFELNETELKGITNGRKCKAFSIIYDGLPTNGILISINELHSSGNTCIFNNSGTHQYLLSSKDKSCVLMVNLKID